jgi:hypothetical protein
MTEGFFVVQVFALAAAFVWTYHRIAGPATARTVAAAVAAWLAFTYALAAAGLLAFGPVPPPMFFLVPLTITLTTVAGKGRYGTLLLERAGIGFLVGFQAFRIAVEIFLWLGSREGFVPPQLTWEGRNWDVITGLTAPVVAYFAARDRLPGPALWAWNIMGLALLVNVVTVAILSMPTPLRLFTDEPANRFVSTAPYVWLPIFLVQAAWFGHLLVFRWLLSVRRG